MYYLLYVLCREHDGILELCLVVFFFKQKTAYEMRISDWSSDVCSSDFGGLADQMPRHKNIRCHAICLNLHGAAQIAAIHGVVCYAVTNQIAVKGEVGDLMGNAEPPANSGVASIHINREATFSDRKSTRLNSSH